MLILKKNQLYDVSGLLRISCDIYRLLRRKNPKIYHHFQNRWKRLVSQLFGFTFFIFFKNNWRTSVRQLRKGTPKGILIQIMQKERDVNVEE